MTSTQELVKRRDLPVETVACYLCGATSGTTLVDDPPFRVILCDRCELGYTSPRIRADRIQDIYNLGYFSSESATDFGYASYADDREGFERTFDLKARIVQRHLPEGRVLEVGCAAGFFLDALRKRGFEVHGLEVSESILTHARDVLKLPNLFLGTLANYPGPPGSFDGVLMWDVIEHMTDPILELRRVRALLKPRGLVFLQTQDLSSLTRKVLGSRWTHFKQLEHIYHFSPKTIRVLLDRAGFEVLEIRKRGAGKHLSFRFIVERTKRFGFVPHLLASPLRLFPHGYLYVNPWDELIVTARSKDT